MGQVALPELRRYGYSSTLATGVLAAGGTLGILIPPSVVLVIYAILTEQNIIKMFAAALVPGILAAIGYMLAVAIYVRVNPDAAQSAPRVRYGERLLNLLKTWPVIAVFSIVIGGIYLGIFTPTEAAAIGTALTGAYAVIVGRCNAVDFIQCLINTAHTTAMIFLIVLSATVFNSFLAFTQTPAQLAAWVTDSGLTPFTVLMLMLLTYLLLGCVMDSLSMILLTIPVFFPIIIALDFGMTPEETAIWFGVLVLIVVEVGLITPPVGMNLFVINALARDTPLRSTYMGVLPFVAADMVRVVVLIALPPITLGLVWAIF
jgi:tripartite ATP-independent transporter DctM subunit